MSPFFGPSLEFFGPSLEVSRVLVPGRDVLRDLRVVAAEVRAVDGVLARRRVELLADVDEAGELRRRHVERLVDLFVDVTILLTGVVIRDARDGWNRRVRVAHLAGRERDLIAGAAYEGHEVHALDRGVVLLELLDRLHGLVDVDGDHVRELPAERDPDHAIGCRRVRRAGRRDRRVPGEARRRVLRPDVDVAVVLELAFPLRAVDAIVLEAGVVPLARREQTGDERARERTREARDGARARRAARARRSSGARGARAARACAGAARGARRTDATRTRARATGTRRARTRAAAGSGRAFGIRRTRRARRRRARAARRARRTLRRRSGRALR